MFQMRLFYEVKNQIGTSTLSYWEMVMGQEEDTPENIWDDTWMVSES